MDYDGPASADLIPTISRSLVFGSCVFPLSLSRSLTLFLFLSLFLALFLALFLSLSLSLSACRGLITDNRVVWTRARRYSRLPNVEGRPIRG